MNTTGAILAGRNSYDVGERSERAETKRTVRRGRRSGQITSLRFKVLR